jgi:hypothetical protein
LKLWTILEVGLETREARILSSVTGEIFIHYRRRTCSQDITVQNSSPKRAQTVPSAQRIAVSLLRLCPSKGKAGIESPARIQTR